MVAERQIALDVDAYPHSCDTSANNSERISEAVNSISILGSFQTADLRLARIDLMSAPSFMIEKGLST